jgi:hypothetical protein
MSAQDSLSFSQELKIGQLITVHTFKIQFSKTYFTIIHKFLFNSTKWFVSMRILNDPLPLSACIPNHLTECMQTPF